MDLRRFIESLRSSLPRPSAPPLPCSPPPNCAAPLVTLLGSVELLLAAAVCLRRLFLCLLRTRTELPPLPPPLVVLLLLPLPLLRSLSKESGASTDAEGQLPSSMRDPDERFFCTSQVSPELAVGALPATTVEEAWPPKPGVVMDTEAELGMAREGEVAMERDDVLAFDEVSDEPDEVIDEGSEVSAGHKLEEICATSAASTRGARHTDAGLSPTAPTISLCREGADLRRSLSTLFTFLLSYCSRSLPPSPGLELVRAHVAFCCRVWSWCCGNVLCCCCVWIRPDGRSGSPAMRW
jgi:hypothetical protein